MQHFWLLWLIVAIVCLTLEMTSGDFFLTCFAITVCEALRELIALAISS